LYYLNARMYDPKVARFLQEDTYTGDPNDPLSLNLYTYCANNPLIYYDPTGHNFVAYWWENKKAEWKAGWEALTIPEKREEAFELIDEYGDLDYIEKRELALKVAYLDMVKGIVDIGKKALDSGVIQHYMLEAGRKLGVGGLSDDTVYQITRNTIDEKLANEKEALDKLPNTIVKAVVEDFKHVVNPKNAYNYFLNPNAKFGELVDYSKSTINTVMTVYGGAKSLQSGANALANIKFTTPSTISISNSMATFGRSITFEAGLAGNNGWMAGAFFFGTGSVDSYINYATGNSNSGNIGNYPSSYQERFAQTPKSNGTWTGKRGESKFISNDPKVNEILSKYGLDGIEYRNAIPDFSKLAWGGDVKIKNMQGAFL
jgi:hypothetical protein